MELYEQLLEEEYIKNIYSSIENNPRIPISHGIHHILNVVEYCKRLSEIFGLNERERETLLVAAVMHDVAQVFLQPNHAKNGAFIAKEMLEQNETIDPVYIKKCVDIDRVCKIIESHGGKKEEDYEDKLSCFLILADKLDITKDRLREKYKLYDFLWYMECVEKVDLKLIENTLNINIFTNKKCSFDDLNDKKGLDKVIKILEKFSKKMHVDYLINIKHF